MISIHQQMSELDRLEARSREAREGYREALISYREAIRDAAEYAIEVEPSRTGEFREQVRGLANGLEDAGAAQLAASRARLRQALAEYQGAAQARIERMRREVREAAEALQAVGARLTESAGSAAGEIEQQIQSLQALAGESDLDAVRRGLRHAAAQLARQVQDLRAENERIVAQMRDEIRTLQRQMEHTQRPAAGDAQTGLAGRREAEAALAAACRANAPSVAGVLYLRNWKRLKLDHNPRQQNEILQALQQRLRATFGAEAFLSRWAEDEILVLFRAGAVPPDGRRFHGLLTPLELPGACCVAVQSAWGVVEIREHEPPEGVLDRLAALERCLTR